MEPRFFANDPDYRADLRKPFPPEQIGKRPGGTTKGGPKSRCKDCGGYHEPASFHLDFVGHAAVTERLNNAAPDWSYTIDTIKDSPDGLHVLGVMGTMTIGGKSIPEVGEPERQSQWGPELKLAVSDFIKRGAMRFGVGLDLWSKEDLSSGEVPSASPASGASPGTSEGDWNQAPLDPEGDGAPPSDEPEAEGSVTPSSPSAEGLSAISRAQLSAVKRYQEDLGWTDEALLDFAGLTSLQALDKDAAKALLKELAKAHAAAKTDATADSVA